MVTTRQRAAALAEAIAANVEGSKASNDAPVNPTPSNESTEVDDTSNSETESECSSLSSIDSDDEKWDELFGSESSDDENEGITLARLEEQIESRRQRGMLVEDLSVAEGTRAGVTGGSRANDQAEHFGAANDSDGNDEEQGEYERRPGSDDLPKELIVAIATALYSYFDQDTRSIKYGAFGKVSQQFDVKKCTLRKLWY